VEGRIEQVHGPARATCELALVPPAPTSAHVTALQVTPAEAYVAFDGFGGVLVMNDVMKSIDEGAARLKALIERELAREDVSWDHVQANGNTACEIVRRAALADLVVTGRDGTSDLGRPSISLLGDLVQSLRTPLFLCSEAPVDPAGPAIIAWDGSHEAANAMRGSIGLLKLSSSVRVLQITSKPETPGKFPGTALVKYLSRQGNTCRAHHRNAANCNGRRVCGGELDCAGTFGR
jgi:nucleotide-binding universal stress UspA family protein